MNLLNSCGTAAWQTVFHFHVHVIPRYEDEPCACRGRRAPGDREEIASASDQLR